MDAFDSTISCSGKASVTITDFTTQNPALWVAISPSLTMVTNPNNENSFTATLDNTGILHTITTLDSYKCSMAGPSVILTTNKVTAPTTADGVPSAIVKYSTGAASEVITVNDFSVDNCASGGSGSPTLTYTISTSPGTLGSSAPAALTVASDGSGKLNMALQTNDNSLIGLYDVTVKGQLSTGEYGTFTFKVQITSSSTPVTVTFGKP